MSIKTCINTSIYTEKIVKVRKLMIIYTLFHKDSFISPYVYYIILIDIEKRILWNENQYKMKIFFLFGENVLFSNIVWISVLCHIIDVASVYFFKYRKRQSFFSIGSKDWYLLQLFYDPSRELSSKTFLVVVVESPPFLNLNNYYCFLQFLHDNGEIRFLN